MKDAGLRIAVKQQVGQCVAEKDLILKLRNDFALVGNDAGDGAGVGVVEPVVGVFEGGRDVGECGGRGVLGVGACAFKIRPAEVFAALPMGGDDGFTVVFPDVGDVEGAEVWGES